MKTQRGFTLTELMIVLVIGGILASIALPSFQDFVKDNRITAETNEFIADMYYARTEAIKRNRRVTVCKSSNPADVGATCDTANNLNWTQGWIIFVDTQGPLPGNPPDGLRQPAELVLRTHGAMAADLTLTPVVADVSIQQNISYIPRGITQQIGGNAQTGVMRVCDDRGVNDARAILISATGRVSAIAPPDAAAQVGACP